MNILSSSRKKSPRDNYVFEKEITGRKTLRKQSIPYFPVIDTPENQIFP